ncbi:hypothetical protein C0J52_27971 [Blattella germanica]|nr:hypothetical protein C0J52_27971 [Blattella germanica]
MPRPWQRPVRQPVRGLGVGAICSVAAGNQPPADIPGPHERPCRDDSTPQRPTESLHIPGRGKWVHNLLTKYW